MISRRKVLAFLAAAPVAVALPSIPGPSVAPMTAAETIWRANMAGYLGGLTWVDAAYETALGRALDA